MNTNVSNVKFEIRFDGKQVDVTKLIVRLDKIHQERSNPNSPLKIVVPAAGSQPAVAIAAAIHYASRWNGVLFLGMHYVRTFHPAANEPARFISPYFSQHDREMFYPNTPGETSCLSAIDETFGSVGYAYEAMLPDVVITEATATRIVDGVLVRSQGASADYSHRLIVSGKYDVIVIENHEQPWINGNHIPESVVTESMRFDSDVYTVPEASKSPEMTVILDTIADQAVNLM